MLPPIVYVISRGEKVLAGRYDRIHSRFPSVINFLDKEMVLSLCTRSVCGGPRRVVIDLDDLSEVRSYTHGSCCEFLNDSVVLDSYEIIADCHPQELSLPEHPSWQAWLDMLWAAFKLKSSPEGIFHLLSGKTPPNSFSDHLAKQLTHGLLLLEDGRLDEAAHAIKGRGAGFTPAGDDFLCGLLLGMAWLDRCGKKTLSKSMDAIYDASRSSNPLVNTFLHQARHLELNADWVSLLNSSCHPATDPVNLLDAILAHGSTSGADELFGFFTACRLFGAWEPKG